MPAVNEPRQSSDWICKPAIDLTFFVAGWLPIFLGVLLVQQQPDHDKLLAVVLTVILAVNFLHRHITFPLVYGEPEIRRQRPRTYVLLPIAFLVLTLGSLLYVSPAAIVLPSHSPQANAFQAPQQRLKLRYSLDGENKQEFKLPAQLRLNDAEALQLAVDDAAPGIFDVSEVAAGVEVALKTTSSGSWLRIRGKTIDLERLALQNKGDRVSRAKRPILALLAGISVLWTIYHTLMQKLGILRIYSRKRRSDRTRQDRWLVFGWFAACLLLLMASETAVTQAQQHAADLVGWLDQAAEARMPLRAAGFVAAAAMLVATASYWRSDRLELGGLSWAKWSFVGSLLALFVALSIDLFAGYVAFGFSHSLEYLAFVVIFSRRKYAAQGRPNTPMRRWSQHPIRSLAVFFGALTLCFVLLDQFAQDTLYIYIVGSSFLHFLYDGWIWKVRRPEVSKPLELQSMVTSS